MTNKYMSLLEYIQLHFEIEVIDFEFSQPGGENPKPVCMTSVNLKSGRSIQQWYLDDKKHKWPFDNNKTLFVAHYAPAEAATYLSLLHDNLIEPPAADRNKIKYVYDTLVQDKKLHLGKVTGGFTLLDCCERYKINTISETLKDTYRDVIINNYPDYTEQEKLEILKYNLTDVQETLELFKCQLKEFEKTKIPFKTILSQALFSGKSQVVAANIERNGIPINLQLHNRLEKNFEKVKEMEIEEINKITGGIYVDGVRSKEKFKQFLIRENLYDDWPKTKKGNLKEDDRTLYRFQNVNKKIAQLREAIFIIDSKKLRGSQIGSDGRSRCSLNLYGQITGRTNLSTKFNPFGAPRRMRNIIGADKDHILVYADFKSQEAVIQAVLSGDPGMLDAVKTGDPYLATAISVNAVPADATKKKYPVERETYKQTFLASGYGQTHMGLKAKLEITNSEAKFFLTQFRKLYSRYFQWIDGVINFASARGFISTKLGWRYYLSPFEVTNPRRLMNWPLQSHGSEILRQTIIDLDDAGYEISTPVHDAVLVHMNRKGCAASIRKMKRIMSLAAKKIIEFEIPVDVKIIRDQFRQDGEHQ